MWLFEFSCCLKLWKSSNSLLPVLLVRNKLTYGRLCEICWVWIKQTELNKTELFAKYSQAHFPSEYSAAIFRTTQLHRNATRRDIRLGSTRDKTADIHDVCHHSYPKVGKWTFRNTEKRGQIARCRLNRFRDSRKLKLWLECLKCKYEEREWVQMDALSENLCVYEL